MVNVLHIANLLEVSFVQKWKECPSHPVNTEDINIEALLKVIPKQY